MKIAYDHLIDHISTRPSIEEISRKLFQLGHENEITNNILDIDFTPNRGDCLSIKGLLRDLKAFYEIDLDFKIYENNIDEFKFIFENHATDDCPKISFMKIEIDKKISKYKDYFNRYFVDLDNNTNNFFTDISNFISYETGQPIHCYDAKKISNTISLGRIKEAHQFNNLFDEKIELNKNDLVFKNDDEIINLAGIIGGKNSACSKNTFSVIVECAYFNPESIIGKSVKYGINSEAAYKFERGVDIMSQELVLRRFAKVVEDHVPIKSIELCSNIYSEYRAPKIPYSVDKINKVLGTNISNDECLNYLKKFGFKNDNELIVVPSHRNDISSINDLSEEVARSIGYDNIKREPISIKTKSKVSYNHLETIIRNALLKSGFYEVINSPFVSKNSKNAIKIDNPLDSRKRYLRTNLKDSLIENLLYNERRQKDSIKLFEISNIYNSLDKQNNEKKIGIIASGRVGKNYRDFSKKIDTNYLLELLNKNFPGVKFKVELLSRDNLDTKIKNKICYIEFNIDLLEKVNIDNQTINNMPENFNQYSPVSEYPSSYRDLSFLIKDCAKYYALQELILSFKHKLLIEVFIFDFYENKESEFVKIGFRFVFQSITSTVTENEVNKIIEDIVNSSLSLGSIEIPGLSKWTL